MFFFIIKQAKVLYKYCESIETLNPQGNTHSPYSETLHLKQAVRISAHLWCHEYTIFRPLTQF